MKITLLAAAAVLALGIGSAFAGEDLSSLQQSGPVVTGVGSVTLPASAFGALSQDSGSNEMPAYAAISVPAANGMTVLAPDSSNQGMQQSVNSLPGAVIDQAGEVRYAWAGSRVVSR